MWGIQMWLFTFMSTSIWLLALFFWYSPREAAFSLSFENSLERYEGFDYCNAIRYIFVSKTTQTKRSMKFDLFSRTLTQKEHQELDSSQKMHPIPLMIQSKPTAKLLPLHPDTNIAHQSTPKYQLLYSLVIKSLIRT